MDSFIINTTGATSNIINVLGNGDEIVIINPIETPENINPTYVLEYQNNKVNTLLNPNSLSYPSTLAVSAAINTILSGLTAIISAATSGLSSNWIDIEGKPLWLTNSYSGHTHQQYLLSSIFSAYSGNTSTYASKSNFNLFTGTTAPNTYTSKAVFNAFTGNTSTYVSKAIFNTYTGTTAPNAFANKSVFNTYTGTTAPSTYYSKAQINTYTGATNTSINYFTNRINQTFNGAVLLDKELTQYNSFTVTGATTISVSTGATAIVGGGCEGVIVADGNNTPTLVNITKWVNSADYDNTNTKQNHYFIIKLGQGVYIFWTQLN